jgi:indole-3-acetate monooxygenase
MCASVEHNGSDLEAARIDFRLACSHAAEISVGIVLKVNDLIGARALAESQPFERRERDVRAAAKHVAMSTEQFVVGGRYALGGDLSGASF